MTATLLHLLHSRAAQTLGWTLLHSLWLLAAIAAAWAFLLASLRRAAADARYLAACLGMALMAAAPISAFFYLLPPAAPLPAPRMTLIRQTTSPEAAAITPVPPILPFTSMTTLPTLHDRLRHALEPALPTAVTLYFAGTALMLARLLAGYAQLRRILHTATPLSGRPQARLADLARRMHITRTVQLLQSAAVEVPTLIGALKPVILLPASALTGLSPDQLSALLAHELAHIRRHDYLLNILQSIIETLLFYHPAVWWLAARIRLEREHCCDDAAVALEGNRLAYARALAAMESLRAPTTIALAATGAGGTSLLTRIQRLLNTPATPRPRRLISAWAALALLLAITLIYIGCNRSTPAPTTTATNQTAPATIATDANAHTYDIRYLLGPVANKAASQNNAQIIIDTILSTVAPDSWKQNGGTAEIHESSGTLTITQSPENLQKIDDLLAQIFETSALAVNIEIRALLVSNNFFDDFRIGWNLAVPPHDAALSAPANNASIIDNWTLNLLLTATQADQRTVTLTAPRTAIPNGYPVEWKLPVHSQAATNTVPLWNTGNGSQPLETLGLRATATASADRRYIILSDLQFSTTPSQPSAGVLRAEAAPAGVATTGSSTAPALPGSAFGSANSRLPKPIPTTPSTMLSLPDGGTLLINGGPVSSTLGGHPDYTILLLVRPNLVQPTALNAGALFHAGTTQPASQSRGNQILVKALAANVDPAIVDQVTAELLQGHTPGTPLVISGDATRKLAEIMPAPSIFSRPSVLMNEGEFAVITIGQQQNYIADITPQPDGTNNFNIKTLSTGLTLKLNAVRTATSSPDASPAIHLDLDATLTALIRMDQGPATAPGPNGNGEIRPQLPILDTRQTKTAVTTEANQPIAIIIPPSGAPGAPKTATVLILTPRFVNQSDLSMDEAAGTGR